MKIQEILQYVSSFKGPKCSGLPIMRLFSDGSGNIIDSDHSNRIFKTFSSLVNLAELIKENRHQNLVNEINIKMKELKKLETELETLEGIFI